MNNLSDDMLYFIKLLADDILLYFIAHNAKTQAYDLNANMKNNIRQHIATLYCKVCLMSIKTGQFVKLYKIICNYVKPYKLCLFFLYRQQKRFWNTAGHL